LFRHVGSDECVQLLGDATKAKKGTKEESLAKDFLKHYCDVNGIDEAKVGEPFGALRRKAGQ
jgi:hypothetical protein